MEKTRWVLTLCTIVVSASFVVGMIGASTARAQPAGSQPQAVSQQQSPQQAAATGYLALAIAISIGASCLGAGYAVGHVGAAALGAASEKPELLTRSLLFVALAEGIAIYGLLIAILLWIRL